MKAETGWRNAGFMRRAVTLGVSFVLFSIQPTLGGAAVSTETFSTANITVATPLVQFYEYAGGTPTTWTDSADFEAGTLTSVNASDQPGSVVLNRIGPTGVLPPDSGTPWWDTDWSNRRCYQIDHSAVGAVSVTEYQLRIDFPITSLVTEGCLQAALGDLRAISFDGATSLPLWQDDTTPAAVWLQVDSIDATTTSTVCLYFGYLPGTATSPANHTEEAVFTSTSAKAIYYAVGDEYLPPGSDINVVSYIDDNEVTRDADLPITLTTAGDLATFDAAGTTQGSVFSVLGPISAAGVEDGAGTLVPISFAGTSFAFPISRDAQQFSFLAPFGDATVELYEGTTLLNTFTVVAGTPYTHVADDISLGALAIIESDTPVLVTHRSDLGNDAVPLYPATAGDFYAVRSASVAVGYTADSTSVSVSGSDGTTSALPGDRGDVATLAGGTGQGGAAADGIWLTADNPVAVFATEDGDGSESVTVLPRTELASFYWIPTDSQYIAASCPTAGSADVPLIVAPPGIPARAVTCAGGPDVAWGLDTADLSVTTAGISIDANPDALFHAYYEKQTTEDQTMLLGMKQGRQYTWPEPVVTPGSDEGILETAGTWESETIDTGSGTGVFGEVSLSGSVPPSSTLRLQIATAPSGTPTAFVGPDGTSGTFFEIAGLPAVVDFDHDGDRFVRARAELATTAPDTTSPALNAVTVDSHLPAISRSLGVAPTSSFTTTIDPSVTSSYVLRVKTSDPSVTGSRATAVYRGAVNLANLAEETVRFVNSSLGVDSVQQSTTQPVDAPLLFQQNRPHSVVFDHSAIASGSTRIVFAWQLDYTGTGSIFLETDFAVEVTAP